MAPNPTRCTAQPDRRLDLTSTASPWLQELCCWARIYRAISARSETDAHADRRPVPHITDVTTISATETQLQPAHDDLPASDLWSGPASARRPMQMGSIERFEDMSLI